MTTTNDKADRRRFVLDADAFDAFERLLDEPFEDAPALRDLLETPTVFDVE